MPDRAEVVGKYPALSGVKSFFCESFPVFFIRISGTHVYPGEHLQLNGELRANRGSEMNLKHSLIRLLGGDIETRGHAPTVAPVLTTAPGTQIHYDAGLIKRFSGHHGVLVDLVGKVRACAVAGDYPRTAIYIRKFKLMLNEHLLEENLRLYTYLSHCLKEDAEGNELMQDMRKEMAGIGRAVTQFIRHYEEFGVDARNAAKFVEELDGIIAALADRIEREERSLYTLYMPPAQAV